jgi:hypothetical protein
MPGLRQDIVITYFFNKQQGLSKEETVASDSRTRREMPAGVSVKARYPQTLVQICFLSTTAKQEGKVRVDQSILVY